MKLMGFIDNRPKPVIIVVGGILVLVIGTVDYVTGYEYSASIFYLFPISFVSWYAGQLPGIYLSLLSAAVWLIADLASGHSYSSNIAPLWNASVRLGFFYIVSNLLALLRKELSNIKTGIYKGTERSGIYSLSKKQKKGATALFYHGAEKNIINPTIQELHVPFSILEKQVSYLKKNYEIISLDDLCSSIENGYKVSPSQVIITFDDGYKNNIDIIAPFLKAYDIPFSIFISTSHISSGTRFPTYYLRIAIHYAEQEYIDISSMKMKFDISIQEKRRSAMNLISKEMKRLPEKDKNVLVQDLISLLPNDRWLELNNIFRSEQPMDWDDVKKLNDWGVTIGSHCHDHAILHSKQSNEEIDYQLKTSKDLLEKHLGECKYFAYPNGGEGFIKSDSILSVKKCGYLLGFTVVPGEIMSDLNPYILPRMYVSYDMDGFKFQLNAGHRHNRGYSKWSHKIIGEA